MSFQSSNTTLPPGLPVRSGDLFANELAALVQDIQRTREWFNHRLDAQLASLRQLCAATHAEESKCTHSVATLLEAPRPVTLPSAEPTPSMVTSAPAAVPAPAPAPAVPPPQAPVKTVSTVHQAIILPPTLTATLDPQLEQATLHELNNALTRAFSEISARGGMIS
ncbi:MAG: hypothetical protein WAW39_03555 [Prosthecobacter sp.]|uniref:hypothetical protein n=1 Tax=Prosthecobacter sp. TaxID=1965333 RepID=UPI003BAFF7E1